MRKQSEGLTKEYDRLLEEHAKLQVSPPVSLCPGQNSTMRQPHGWGGNLPGAEGPAALSPTPPGHLCPAEWDPSLDRREWPGSRCRHLPRRPSGVALAH